MLLSLRANAISSNVFNVPGAPPIKALISVLTLSSTYVSFVLPLIRTRLEAMSFVLHVILASYVNTLFNWVWIDEVGSTYDNCTAVISFNLVACISPALLIDALYHY